MTRLDRVLELFEKYDSLVVDCIKCLDSERWQALLNAYREEKEKLTQELIEHGCRRKY
jgi:hypothetical protein